MSASKPITIIGGGLAGLTLGIGLRQRGIPTTIFEAGKYPRHRVCGEFICGRGEETLQQLGLRELFLKAGAFTARTAGFFLTRRVSAIKPLPSSALCLSRFEMDALLAKHFQKLGGELRENERCHETEISGFVRATGRQLHSVENGWRWFGLKVHARNVALTADLEMHLTPHGYVGLSKLSGGLVNICGLFRRRVGNGDSPARGSELLRGQPGTLLHEKLERAEFDEESFCSIAGLSLRPQSALARTECRIGDAITMIPPVTGNGMSMAFESAEVAIEPLAAYGRGEISWMTAQQTIARRCDELFARRLNWANFLQRMIFTRGLQHALVAIAPRFDFFWQILFSRTR